MTLSLINKVEAMIDCNKELMLRYQSNEKLGIKAIKVKFIFKKVAMTENTRKSPNHWWFACTEKSSILEATDFRYSVQLKSEKEQGSLQPF